MKLTNIPVQGTPLVPPSYLTIYLVLFLVCLFVLYRYYARKRRPVRIWQKIRLFVVLGFLLKATAVGGGLLLAAYWLVPTPGIRRTVPQINKIEIVFDKPVSRNQLEKTISPDTPGVWVFEDSIYTTHLYRKLVFYPTYSLKQNTTYTVKLSKIQNLIKVSEPYDYQFDFTTEKSPTVTSVTPANGTTEVPVTSQIHVTLDKPNERMSDFSFQFIPHIDYRVDLNASKTDYTITPKAPLVVGTQYSLKVQKTDIIVNLEDDTVVERGVTQTQYQGTFTTKPDSSGRIRNLTQQAVQGPAKVVSITPENGWTGVNVQSNISITFDQVIDHEFAQQNFLMNPKVVGSFSWEGQVLIFKPKQALAPATRYVVTWRDSKSEFTTQSSAVKLAVPAYLQKYTLSCEIASLRMALNFRGLTLSEDDLIPKVGVDSTPHTGNTWGNPYNAFVGNIRGTQMKDGYGVYWGPIAKAAREYRKATEFQNWNITQLTEALSANNPVIVWVYSHHGTVTSWNTPDGTNIYAVRDEHAVVVVGFVGPANNPTQLIVNDPLIGQVYWSRATFDSKWKIFNHSGVVVY